MSLPGGRASGSSGPGSGGAAPRARLALGLVTVLLLLAGLGSYLDSHRVPGQFRSREDLPSCGSATAAGAEVLEGLAPAAAACFDTAVGSDAGAELRLVTVTVEGDEVVSYYRALPGGGAEVFVDSTDDSDGSGTWTLRTCPQARSLSDLGDCASAESWRNQ